MPYERLEDKSLPARRIARRPRLGHRQRMGVARSENGWHSMGPFGRLDWGQRRRGGWPVPRQRRQKISLLRSGLSSGVEILVTPRFDPTIDTAGSRSRIRRSTRTIICRSERRDQLSEAKKCRRLNSHLTTPQPHYL